MATPSAGHRLVHITELLEMILLNLDTDQKADLITLFDCMRVSTTFYNTIKFSTPLQQQLFLLRPTRGPSDVVKNLLLESSTANKQVPDGSWASIGPCSDYDVCFNRRFPSTTTTPLANGTEPSWRRMYLYKTQYSIRSIKLREWDQPDVIRTVFRRNPMMGELVDAIFEESLKVQRRNSVWDGWRWQEDLVGSAVATLDEERRERVSNYVLRPLGT